MKIIYFFTRDLGGEFGPGKLADLAKTVGELTPEPTTSVYSDYFRASGLAPVRVCIRRNNVVVNGCSMRLTASLKMFSYGVLLFEYCFEPVDPDTDPRSVFPVKKITMDDGRVVELEALGDADLLSFQGKLTPHVKKEYEAPLFHDYFHLFVDSKARPEDEVMGILLPGGESYDYSKKRRIVKNINLWEENESFFIMGNRGYLFTMLDSAFVLTFLELARVQLYELKIYDYILDQGIESTYRFLDELPHEERIFPLYWMTKSFKGQVRQVLSLTEIRMDLVDLVKDITNTMKVTNDPYFELLYNDLNETFHVNEWFVSVKEKIEETGEAQKMILSRLDIHRSTALEMTIIILILIEIVMPLIHYLASKLPF